MEWWQVGVYVVISVCVSILSGIAGAGGGFIMTPLLIALGLTPAQAVATGKLSGLSIAVGSLRGMRSMQSQVSWRRIVAVMILALGAGLLSPFIITSLDHRSYRVILGVLILLLIPVVLLKKIGIKTRQPSRWKKYLGVALLELSLLLQGAFSGGLGTLVNVVLMSMLGMTANEANITKRWSQVVLNITVVLGVVGSGLIAWQVAAIAIPTTFIGGHIGGHLAVKKGNHFVINIMVGLMVVSGLYLIFG